MTPDPDLLPLGDDADLSEWQAVAAGQGPMRLGAVICTRFDAGDAGLVRQAAQKSGLTQSQFVRRAVMHAAGRALGVRVRGRRLKRKRREEGNVR